MTDVERKIQLTRFIREENALNRMKLKNREHILYGNGKQQYGDDDLPLVYDGYLEEGEFGAVRPAQPAGGSTLGLRIVLAVLLFAAVVYLDRTGVMIDGQFAAQVIARQIAVSDEGKLIDFVSNFPYTLSDENEE
ncbi:MAG: hypothetical protein Q4C58_05455 [Eubacteriales bacterium]|nr:hypothetical protein [Eubacteriales bacterium]